MYEECLGQNLRGALTQKHQDVSELIERSKISQPRVKGSQRVTIADCVVLYLSLLLFYLPIFHSFRESLVGTHTA